MRIFNPILPTSLFRLLKACLDSPNPEAALNNFSRFAVVTFNRKWVYQLFRDAPFLMQTVMLRLWCVHISVRDSDSQSYLFLRHH